MRVFGDFGSTLAVIWGYESRSTRNGTTGGLVSGLERLRHFSPDMPMRRSPTNLSRPAKLVAIPRAARNCTAMPAWARWRWDRKGSRCGGAKNRRWRCQRRNRGTLLRQDSVSPADLERARSNPRPLPFLRSCLLKCYNPLGAWLADPKANAHAAPEPIGQTPR